MFRYVAFAWEAASATQAQEVSALAGRLRNENRWTSTYRTGGLWVFCSGARPGSSEIYILPDGRGVVLGKLFDVASSDRGLQAISERLANRIHATQGRSLTTDQWGRYVALLHDSSSGITRVLRDPTGGLPCFFAAQEGIRVVFSDIQDLARIQPTRTWGIDWQYLARRLASSRLVREEPRTGLTAVSRILPGECVELTGEGVRRRRYWSARDIISQGSIDSVEAATDAVRTATERSVHAWASCYPKILHLLSGGFDSSVVLSCLRSAPARPEVSCVNYFDSACASDEREYARLAAATHAAPLFEIQQVPGEIRLERMFAARRFAIPWSFLYFIEHSDEQGELAARTGATAIFSGTAGDQIFFQGPLPLAAADCLRRLGPGRAFFDYCHALARIQGRSIWTLILAALRDRMRIRANTPMDSLGDHKPLVSRDVLLSVEADAQLRQRWAELGQGLPTGKAYHAHAMSCGHEFYDPIGGENYPERVRPLVSQPLIETCLRIPTYVLAADGFDRAAARRAFRGSVPDTILRRQMKGAIDTYLARMVSANLPFLRETMLDGLLVRNGLLDRGGLERTLSGTASTAPPEACEVVASYLSTEVWARGWAA